MDVKVLSSEKILSVSISFHFIKSCFIHGGPINQGWLLVRGPWEKPNYNVTKKQKKKFYNAKLE